MKLITLTTDFGTRDWFVGAMKGVILGICPGAVMVDITHEIPAGDIRAGAFALAAGHRFFPKGTVHVAVVDPGVGSSRHAIAVRTADHFFVGPDNGVLSFALARERIKSIRRLENRKYFLEPVSSTFHGRDIFSPVAAHLCRGVPLGRLGPAQEDYVRLPRSEPKVLKHGIEGEVVHIDRFGNAITNVGEGLLAGLQLTRLKVRAGRKSDIPVRAHYQAVAPGKPVAMIGSGGWVEIAINGGSAADELKLKVGGRIRVVTELD